MMSRKCKYAIKALVRLAHSPKQELWHTADIAKLDGIPKKFLELILRELKQARIVNSKQGIHGGYYLILKPKDITVADVYRLFDGAIAPVPCVSLNFYEKCDDCKSEQSCELRDEFIKIREGARKVMSNITIQSFLESSKKDKKRR